MERLGGFLVSIGGQAPSCSDLAHTASQFNEKRIGVYDSMREHPEEARTEAIARVFECGSTREPKKRPTGSRKLVPVALLGGALFAPEWPLLDAVETAGGLVVVNGMEPGERCLVPPVPISDHGLTMACLADHYFDHIVDVFPRPNSQLYSWLAPRLQERKARGIILWVRVGCDLWRAEAASLRETFRLPVLVLDSHRLEGLAPGRPAMRDLNRISAFIESLQ
jgi:benzoyl-CoA reductase/2-hydroxyglutaryl-CoA dehydratase subunit BcrC/BadD/HgdB